VSHVRTAVIAFGIAIGVMGLVSNRLRPAPAPAPVPASGLLARMTAADAAQYRQFFAAVADVVERDGKSQKPVLATMFDLRNRYKQALQMVFQGTPLIGKYPGFGAELDAYELQALGALDTPLTAEERAKAASALRAIR